MDRAFPESEAEMQPKIGQLERGIGIEFILGLFTPEEGVGRFRQAQWHWAWSTGSGKGGELFAFTTQASVQT